RYREDAEIYEDNTRTDGVAVVVEFAGVVKEVNSTNRTEGGAEGRNNLEVYVHQDMLRIIRNDSFKLKSIRSTVIVDPPLITQKLRQRSQPRQRSRMTRRENKGWS